MIVHCTWEGQEEDCEEIFGTESTDDGCCLHIMAVDYCLLILFYLVVGYCCSFNSVILTKQGPVKYPNE